VQNLLDANDAEQEHLVRLWLQHTSSQLNIICITVSNKASFSSNMHIFSHIAQTCLSPPTDLIVYFFHDPIVLE
jgi:hypothetical protein